RNLLLDRFLRLLERVDERKRIRRRIRERTPVVGARLGVAPCLHDVTLSLLTVEPLRERAFELVQQAHSIADFGVGRSRGAALANRSGSLEARDCLANFGEPHCGVRRSGWL